MFAEFWMNESHHGLIDSAWKIHEECFHLGLFASSTFDDDLKSHLTFKVELNKCSLIVRNVPDLVRLGDQVEENILLHFARAWKNVWK